MKKYTITEIKLVEQCYTYEVEAETEEDALEKCENTQPSIEEIGECRFYVNGGDTYDNKVIDGVEELEDEEYEDIKHIKFVINEIKQNGDTFVLKVKNHYEDYIVESSYNRWTYPNEESRRSDFVEMHFYYHNGGYDYISIYDIIYVLSFKKYKLYQEQIEQQKAELKKQKEELKKQQEEEYRSDMQTQAYYNYKEMEQENMWKD